MAQTENDGKAPVADAGDKPKDGKNSKVADYLAAPRKKRKSYVLMALGQGVKDDLAAGVEAFVRTNFKGFAVASPKTPEELYKNFSRQIVLLLFDDEFTDLASGLGMISELKRRKNSASIPVLFLTRQPAQLIEAYHKLLAPFHEADDYINYQKAELTHVLSKVRFGLANHNRRRSRRYHVDIKVGYFVLGDELFVPDDVKTAAVKAAAGRPGRLLDLSIHGALLKAEGDRIFRPGEQVKLHLPIVDYLPSTTVGDYLKLSARVRRVFINGTQAGISFEYVSDAKLLTLTRYLIEMGNDQTVRRVMAQRAKASRS